MNEDEAHGPADARGVPSTAPRGPGPGLLSSPEHVLQPCGTSSSREERVTHPWRNSRGFQKLPAHTNTQDLSASLGSSPHRAPAYPGWSPRRAGAAAYAGRTSVSRTALASWSLSSSTWPPPLPILSECPLFTTSVLPQF